MACKKYQITNTGTTDFYFNYKRCSDQMWQYETQLNPSQTKTIWLEKGTYSSPFTNSAGASIVDLGDFPPSGTTTPSTPSTNISYRHKSILTLSSLSGSSNWHYAVLNYDKTTILGPIDTGVNISHTLRDSTAFPHTDGGYMIIFSGVSNINTIFLDFQGNVIDTYTANTTYINTYTTSSFQIMVDYNNGVLVYSNGVSVNMIDFDTNSDFGVDTNYDNSIKDAFVVYSGYSAYSSYNLVNINGIKPLYNWDNRLYECEVPKYENATFIPILAYSSFNEYTFMNIFSSNGTFLQSVDLLNLGHVYTNNDFSFYGSNKMNIIFYNDNDTSVPYLIYNYDGDTNTLISTTHINDNIYNDWNQWYDYFYGYVYGFPSEDIHTIFYSGGGGYDENFYITTYCDILSYFNGDTSYRNPYVYLDDYSGKITVNDAFIGSSFMIFVNSGNTNLSLLTITSSSSNISTICSLSSLDGNYFNYWYFGDKFAFLTRSVGNNDGIIYLYTSNGTQIDGKPWVGDYWVERAYDTLVFEDDNNCWYYNLTTSSLTPLNNFYVLSTSNLYYSSNNHNNSNILMTSFDNTMRVLTSNSLTQPITLPNLSTESYQNILIGKDLVITLSQNNSNDKLIVRLYDLSLKLLRTTITNETNYNYVELIENRAYLQTDNSGNHVYYMIKPLATKSVVLSNYQYVNIANDYTWWND